MVAMLIRNREIGIGKKSLILAIAQSCTHIVHMDSMQSARKNTPRITYASTRPKPWWRAYQGQKLAKRRPSILLDEVLDRNICFVDCNAHTGSSEVRILPHVAIAKCVF